DAGPAVELADGTKKWIHSGKLHREDGPAVEYCNGTKMWCHHGLLHREDGPAMELSDGRTEWWLKGERLTQEEVLTAIQQRQQRQREDDMASEAAVIIEGLPQPISISHPLKLKREPRLAPPSSRC